MCNVDLKGVTMKVGIIINSTSVVWQVFGLSVLCCLLCSGGSRTCPSLRPSVCLYSTSKEGSKQLSVC